MIKILATIILVLFSTGAIANENVRILEAFERFKLWTGCETIEARVSFQKGENSILPLGSPNWCYGNRTAKF